MMDTVIAIDGRPADPAMARALEQIAAIGPDFRARKDRINTDPRIIRLRRMSSELWEEPPHGMDGAEHIFRRMAEGRIARQRRMGSLLRARVAQLDDYQSMVRHWLRDAAAAHRQEHEFVCAVQPDATLEGLRRDRVEELA